MEIFPVFSYFALLLYGLSIQSLDGQMTRMRFFTQYSNHECLGETLMVSEGSHVIEDCTLLCTSLTNCGGFAFEENGCSFVGYENITKNALWGAQCYIQEGKYKYICLFFLQVSLIKDLLFA